MKKAILLFFAVAITLSSALSPVFAASLPSPAVTSTEPDPATVTAAKAQFMALSKKEKKAKFKEVKKEIKKFKKQKKAGAEPVTNTLLLVIICILLPPLSVYLHQGEINSKFWISLLLTLLFYVPGLIYSLIVVLS